MPEAAGAKKRRSGSESRQRTDRIVLRLLPAEATALHVLAERRGHASRQELIRDALRPLIAEFTQPTS